jgi:predicted nucleotidyltransferase
MTPRFPLPQSVLATLAYVDQFDYPLTAAEIWRFLFRPEHEATQDEVNKALAELMSQGKIDREGDWYMLNGRRAIAETRKQRAELSRKKWRRAKSAAEFLRLVPFVRGVFVCNSVAIDNGKKESDVDIVVIIKGGRMFIARFAVTAIVQLMGLRRHGTKIADRVCLSFYVTDDALDFASLRLQPEDPQLAFWVATFVPLINRDHIFQRVREANAWVLEYFPNAFSVGPRDEQLAEDQLLNTVRAFFENAFGGSLGEPLESSARSMQMKRMQRNKHSRQNDASTDVVISDTLLKYHERDRRAENREHLEASLKKLNLL